MRGDFLKAAGAVGAVHLRAFGSGQNGCGLVNLARSRLFGRDSLRRFDMPGSDVVTEALNHLWYFPCGDTIDGNCDSS